MKVNELAKEINLSSEELLNILGKLKIEVKDTESMLNEESVARVKYVLEKKKKAAAEKKKKKIVQVFNPQNSRMSGGPDERLKKRAEQKERAEKESIRKKKEQEAVQKQEAQRKAALAREATMAKIAKKIQAEPEDEKIQETNLKKEEAVAVKESNPNEINELVQSEKNIEKETDKKNISEDTNAEEVMKKEIKTEKAKTEKSKTEKVKTDKKINDNNKLQSKTKEASNSSNNRQNRDGAKNRDAQRPFNKDGRVNKDGQKSFNKDGAKDNQRSFNKDNQRTFNKDGARNGQRTFNKDGAKDGQRSFNKDGQNRGRGFNGQERRKEKMSEELTIQQQKNDRSNQRREKDKDKLKNSHDRFEKQGNKARNNKNQPKAPMTKPVKKEEPKEEVIKNIIIPEKLTLKELCDAMKVQPSVIIKKLFLEGKMVTVNSEIDFDTAEEIALEYNCIAEKEVKVDVIAELLKEDEEAEETLVKRAPVVCVMGHVDHGKTSLLDAIRNTRVTDREAGGITQHIGAYMVKCNGQDITFLDTPGHEAFTAMRMRGANSTDIAILVVAADDGVMPQTVEAINHAKAAGVEIIVAVNKIDKPSANVQRVLQELTEYGLIAEEYGGSTIVAPVSAKTQEGIDNLLEMVLLTSEILELKANPNRKARGIVIEAKLDKGKGPVATVLVQKGTLHVGDFIAAGSSYGKVRAMINDQGRRVKEVGPSTPVEILGFSDVPQAGDIFVNPETDKEARNFAETFVAQNKEKLLEETKAKMSLDDLFSQIQAGNVKELNLIVKADVQGSVEAVKNSLMKLSNEEVVVRVIHGGVGAINESDVILASASNAIIIGFNVKPDAMAKTTAEREGVDLRLYKVIYNAIEDIEAAMKGMLDPVFEEQIIGHGECRQTFKASGVGTIAGSYVLDGIFTRDCSVRITREGENIYDGPLASLKRFKDDVKEVKAGFECGLVFEKFNDVKEGDSFEAYKMVEVPR